MDILNLFLQSKLGENLFSKPAVFFFGFYASTTKISDVMKATKVLKLGKH